MENFHNWGPEIHEGQIQNFSSEGAPIPWGRLPNILVIFSEKPCEIKEILVRRGERVPGAPPPKSATVHVDFTISKEIETSGPTGCG